MKRALCLTLVCAMLFALAPHAFAAGTVIRTEITVEAPVAGESPVKPEVAVYGRTDGGAAKMTEGKDYTLSCVWREEGQKETFTGAFINGRRYELTVTLKGVLANYAMDNDAELYVNEEKNTDKSVLAVKGEDAIYTLPFAAVPGDITPAVSVATEGRAEKEYDGEEVTLRVSVTNLLNGVDYSYQWFKDGSAVTDGAGEAIALKNVSDSGTYTCRVTAATAGEKKETESLPETVKITPHNVTLVLENAEKNEGDPDPTLTYTTLGDVYDPLTGAPAREEGEAEGNYEIQIGTLAFAESVAENYEVTVQNGRFTIAGTGVLTFAALTDVADLSYVVGKDGAHVRVSATRSALPQGAVLTLSTVGKEPMEIFEKLAADKGVMKSLTVSVTNGEKEDAPFNKNAVLRLMIPLTKEEERYEKKTIKAYFLTPGGTTAELLTLKREKDEKTGVVYLVVELRSPGSLAILKGDLLPEETETNEETTPAPRKNAVWLWVLVGLFTATAAGIIIWSVIRAKKSEAPTKTFEPKEKAVEEETKIYEPKKKPEAPPQASHQLKKRPVPKRRPDPSGKEEAQNTLSDIQIGEAVEPPPIAGRVISFDELEEDDD